MIKWTAFPFLRFLAAFISGILFYLNTRSSIHYLPALLFAMACYVLLYIISKKYESTYSFKPFLGITGIVTLFLFGIQVSQHHDILQKEDHISKSIQNLSYYRGTIVNEPEEKEKVVKALVSVNSVKAGERWQASSGIIYVYFKRPFGNKIIYGDQLIIKGKPQAIPPPGNPGEFDYGKYLSYQHIYHQHFISSSQFYKTGNAPPNIITTCAGLLRNTCDKIFQTYLPSEEYKLATALVLGIRTTLDPQVKDAYSHTGTMHILAVSGLHVAIVFQILMLMFGKIKKIKYGAILLPCLLLISLSFYAFITGLSPSVLRAVTMFSFVVIAKAWNRNTNIYNTLAISAMFLLCIDPFYLVDVGFQLSYIAVAGIVYLHPRIYNSVSFLNPVAEKVWEMTSISLAAQLATFPLCLYYFNQFPVYFLFANLLVIPISFLILYLGLGLLAMAWLPIAAKTCAWCLEKLIWFMNQIVLTIEKLPFALINGIDINILETIGIYGIILCFILFIYLKKLRPLSIALLLIVCLSSFSIYKSSAEKINMVVVYKIKGHTALGFYKDGKGEIFLDSTLIAQPSKIKFHLNGHLIKCGLKDIKIRTLEKPDSEIPHCKFNDALLLTWQGKTFLITRKNFDPINYKDLQPDFLIIRTNSIRDISKAKEIIKYKTVIIDSSNSSNYPKSQLPDNSYTVIKDGAMVIDF
jgi:competence protein ComEC